MKNNQFKLIISIIACQLAGGIGAIFTASAIPTWYAGLSKPFFNPPNWVFGPVWTTLYLMMGVSLYLILSLKQNDQTRQALGVFLLQLVLNTLWSILFFGLKSPEIAFFEIILLWVSIAVTIRKFYNLKPLAAYLLIPYLAWVTFASLLNLAIAVLN